MNEILASIAARLPVDTAIRMAKAAQALPHVPSLGAVNNYVKQAIRWGLEEPNTWFADIIRRTIGVDAYKDFRKNLKSS